MNDATQDTTAPGTALTLVERARAALESPKHETELQTLADNTHAIKTITNADAYKECHAARMTLKRARGVIETMGKKARADAVAFSKAVIEEENRLIAIIVPDEVRLLTLQEAHDAKAEAEAEAARVAEEQRKEQMRKRIEWLRSRPTAMINKPHAEIVATIDQLDKVQITEDAYGEFLQQAQDTLTQARITLRDMHSSAIANALEAERLKNEREDFERAQAQQRDRQRAIDAENERLTDERKRLEAQQRAQQEAQEIIDRARDAAVEAKRQRAADVQRRIENIGRVLVECRDLTSDAISKRIDEFAQLSETREWCDLFDDRYSDAKTEHEIALAELINMAARTRAAEEDQQRRFTIGQRIEEFQRMRTEAPTWGDAVLNATIDVLTRDLADVEHWLSFQEFADRAQTIAQVTFGELCDMRDRRTQAREREAELARQAIEERAAQIRNARNVYTNIGAAMRGILTVCNDVGAYDDSHAREEIGLIAEAFVPVSKRGAKS